MTQTTISRPGSSGSTEQWAVSAYLNQRSIIRTRSQIFSICLKPDVDEDEKEFSNPSILQSPSSETWEDQDCDFTDLEEDLEVIILGEDLPPVESEGSQEEPLPLLVAWEESEPRFFYLGYY